MTPSRILLWASPSWRSVRSECECMSMNPGRDDQAAGIDGPPRGDLGSDETDRRRFIAPDRDVAFKPGISGPVDDLAARITRS